MRTPFKLFAPLLSLGILIAVGVVGLMHFEDYSLLDAVYMSVITLTTIGYGEVHPLSENGKIFIMIFAVFGLGLFTYSVSVILGYVVEGSLLKGFKNQKKQNKILKMKDHIIICGMGRNGTQAVRKLSKFKRDFLVIERGEMVEKMTKEMPNLMIMEGDATDDNTLLNANIETASALITTLPKDSDNLFVVLSARQLNRNLKIISRASSESSIQKLKTAGANNVIMPDYLGGDHMASLVVTPDLVEFLDNISFGDHVTDFMKEISTEELKEFSKANTIGDLEIKKRTGCSIIGYKSADGEYIINPDDSKELEKGGNIILIGRAEQIQRLEHLF